MESDTHTNCLARVLPPSFLVKGVLHLARGLWLCELFATTGGGQAEIIASLKSTLHAGVRSVALGEHKHPFQQTVESEIVQGAESRLGRDC